MRFAVLLVAVCAAAVYLVGFCLGEGRPGQLAFDVYGYFYPNMLYALRRLAAGGGGLLWNPFQNCGQPFFGITETALLYPLNVFFLSCRRRSSRCGPCCSPTWSSAAWGRTLSHGSSPSARPAPSDAALAFLLGSAAYHMTTWMPTVQAPYVWLPVAMLCCERLLRAPRLTGALLLGASLAAGAPSRPPAVGALHVSTRRPAPAVEPAPTPERRTFHARSLSSPCRWPSCSSSRRRSSQLVRGHRRIDPRRGAACRMRSHRAGPRRLPISRAPSRTRVAGAVRRHPGVSGGGRLWWTASAAADRAVLLPRRTAVSAASPSGNGTPLAGSTSAAASPACSASRCGFVSSPASAPPCSTGLAIDVLAQGSWRSRRRRRGRGWPASVLARRALADRVEARRCPSWPSAAAALLPARAASAPSPSWPSSPSHRCWRHTGTLQRFLADDFPLRVHAPVFERLRSA